MSPPLLSRTWFHVCAGGALMGGWALHVNFGHPMPAPMLAGLVQGGLSGVITFGLKRSLDGMRARLSRGQGWWVPPLIALCCSFLLLVGVHWLAGTPEILHTISLPYAISCVYAVTYNLIMFRAEAR